MEELITYFKQLEERLSQLEQRLANQEDRIAQLEERLQSQPVKDELPQVEVELIVDDEPDSEAQDLLEEAIADDPVLEDEQATEELLTDEELQAEDELEDKLVEAIEQPAAEQKTGVTLPPLDDIRKAISLGDRFLFQRELFLGDGEKMNKTIEILNGMSSLDEAMKYIDKKFSWDKESQAYDLFLNILRRRY